jgi:hypothetical protein
MVLSRPQIQKELVPGLNAVFGLSYGSVDGEHLPLFDVETSKRAWEEEVLFTMFGTAKTKPEGQGVDYDDAQEAWTARYDHETIALAFAVTEEAVEDDLYGTIAKLNAQALGRALANTKQVKAANVFNLGFSTTRPFGDGQPLFSDSHPTLSAGNQDNKDTADLSETALQNAIIAIAAFKDDRGILIGATPQSLHIPSDLRFTTFKVLKSDLSTITATTGTDGITNTNEINALKSMGFFPKGVFLNHRFTDTDAWFIRTDVPNGTKHFVRKPVQTRMEGDFDTGNMRYKARERYSFGCSNWRQWYGSDGSAS